MMHGKILFKRNKVQVKWSVMNFLSEKFNENILAIVEYGQSDILRQRLLEHLQHLRFCKTVFLLKNSTRNDFELRNIFDFCWKNRMVNIVAVFQDFENSSVYYSYSNFGHFQIEKFIWNKKDSNVFQNRMRDLKGHLLPVIFGGSNPGNIISENTNGAIIKGGYMYHLFYAFAKRHNSILNISNVKTSLSNYDMHNLVLDGRSDISGAGFVLLEDSIQWFSYPYMLFDWSVMLPTEPNIPIYKVFAYVFHWKAFVLTIMMFILLSVSLEVSRSFSTPQRKVCIRNLFFNIDCFRGILGQSFSETTNNSYSTKIVYSLIFLLGIMIFTSYDAFLQSFMTKPPKENMIKSFEDLQSSGLKTYIHEKYCIEFFDKLRPDIMQKYSNVFVCEKSFEKVAKLQNSLNTKFAFFVTDARWIVYEYQQEFFGKKLFRWSKELLLLKNMFGAISINENSIFKNSLNFHILETQSSGLFDFWKKRTFYELLRFGKIENFKYGFNSNLRKSMKVEDLKWIWILMGLALMVAILCFVAEICIFKLKITKL
ncbi:uncharacterized protein LOC129919043 [Episyrphus balteatus]|uniref:uncharacterized protein LOC129919043 n=1 Tax=Episyrphus balteatus TaxID=286459 RepID=UPI002485DDB7|nr:uncharacterized protein LOC129919043 [Episyrphus balteatus]